MTANLTKQQRTLLLLVVAFVLPVVLAKLALQYDYFNRGVTNKGKLLTPTLSLTPALQLEESLQNKWLIISLQLEACDTTCKNAQYAINQVKTALGREMDRAEMLHLSTNTQDQQDNPFDIQNISQEQVTSVFSEDAQQGIYIADPLGNIMLFYQAENDPQAMVMRGREILGDLKRLLKLSKIG